MSCPISTSAIINTHVTCLIVQSVIVSGAFLKGGYNTGWTYNYYNSEWALRYGPRYTAGAVHSQINENSYSSSSNSRSSEDSSDSAPIPNPSTIHKKLVSKKNKCKCSCKDCYKLIECCRDKCNRCTTKPTTKKTKKPTSKNTPTWPPYYHGQTYLFWPYMVPIMYSMKIFPTTSTAIHSTTKTSKTTITTSTCTTTTCPLKTSTTPTTTTAFPTTTTTSPATTTTCSTTTTCPTTTTTTPTTITTCPTTTTTCPTTITTYPTTATTCPTTRTERSTSSTEPPRPHTSTSSTPVIPEEPTTSSTQTYPVHFKNYDADDATTINSHDIYDNTNIEPQELKEYVYYDDTTLTSKIDWPDPPYKYNEDNKNKNSALKKCDTPKCLPKKRKIFYYILKQATTTESPFFMPTKTANNRRRYTIVDNDIDTYGNPNDDYNTVNDQMIRYPDQYYYDNYYYYPDTFNYNNFQVARPSKLNY